MTTSQKQKQVETIVQNLKINIGYILQVIQDSFWVISNSETKLVREVFQSCLQKIYEKRKKQKQLLLKKLLKFIDTTTIKDLFENEKTIEDYIKKTKSPVYIQELLHNLKKIHEKKPLTKHVIMNKLNNITYFVSNFENKSKEYSIGFKPNTLIMNNLHKEEDITILNDYTVTDKAEGEGKLLYILGHTHLNIETRPDKKTIMGLVGKVYMIDRDTVQFTGMVNKQKSLQNCILNGEFMKVNKNNEMINRYLTYDLYYCNETDYHEMPLLTKKGNCRIKKMNGIIKKLKQGNSNLFSITMKRFYMGSNIFKLSKLVYDSPEIDYKLDGLIFTPASSPVGYDKQIQFNSIANLKINNYDLTFQKTWFSNLKWKDSKDNSIDFKIQFVQENGSDLILRDENDKRYKQIKLFCGKMNKITGKYEQVLFIPTSPYDERAYLVNVYIDENNLLYGEWDQFPIENGQVIECAYDLENKKWILLRTRFDKVGTFGNDYFTANSIWKNMHMPITYNMITTGEGIMERETYYFKTDIFNRKQSDILNLRTYHNKVKEVKLTETVTLLRKTNNEIRLLEIACGKGQDMHKWKKNNIEVVVGIDKVRDNIENPYNGAQSRYLDMQHKWSKNVSFLVGDCSKNINNLDAFTIDYYREKAPKIISGSFNLISIQFAIHYFFESVETIDMIMRNIDEKLEMGGYLIGCCFDGEKIRNLLENIPVGGSLQTKIWEIQKYYQDDIDYDEEYQAQKINVYIDSIGQNNEEYLVLFSQLIDLLKEKGIELISLESFEQLGEHKRLSKYYNEMSRDEKTLSNLNQYFVFQKQSLYNDDDESEIASGEQTESDNIQNQSINSSVMTTDTQISELTKKIRACMNLCYDIFEQFKLYLIGARIVVNDKRRMSTWDDFKPYLESIENVRKCIEDLQQYKDNKGKYNMLQYDFDLLEQYKEYLKQIDELMVNKENRFIKMAQRKQNKEQIKTQEIRMLSNLLIECHEDFVKNKFTFTTISKSKYYLATNIKYIHDFKKLFAKEIKQELKKKQINLQNVVDSYKKFLYLDNMRDIYDTIQQNKNLDKAYGKTIVYLEKAFEETTNELNKDIMIKETKLFQEKEFVTELIEFLNNILKNKYEFDNQNLVDKDLIKRLLKTYASLNIR